MQICSKRKPTKLEIKCRLILGVVDVDALEVFLEHLQLAQAAVGEAPVGAASTAWRGRDWKNFIHVCVLAK